MAHWHDHNPWATKIIYLPDLDELSACLDPYRPTDQRDSWLHSHPDGKLDAYILPQLGGIHSCGVRWGIRGDEYYSPHINPYVAELLISKYGPKDPNAMSKQIQTTYNRTLDIYHWKLEEAKRLISAELAAVEAIKDGGNSERFYVRHGLLELADCINQTDAKLKLFNNFTWQKDPQS